MEDERPRNPARIADYDRVVILASAARYPEGTAVVAALLKSKGADPEIFLNTKADDPHVERIGADRFSMIHRSLPPPGWPTQHGAYCHSLAFRAVVGRARRDGLRSLLVVEDDCRFTDDFDAVAAEAEVPADWDLFYFGAMHNWNNTFEAGPRLLRLTGSVGIHCLGINGSAFDAVLGLPEDNNVDCLLGTHIHPAGRCYALWPSVATQAPGPSTVTGDQAGWPGLFACKGVNWPAAPPPIPSAVNDREAGRLAELSAGRTVLEIGAQFGRSTVAMAEGAAVVHSVDHHRGDPHTGPGGSLPTFAANVEARGLSGKVVAHVGEARQVAAVLADATFDFVFVDGYHGLEETLWYIEFALRCVRPGGLIAFHDYYDRDTFLVKSAVDARFPRLVDLVDTLAVVSADEALPRVPS